MSTIGSHLPSFPPPGLDPAGGRVALDDLRQPGLAPADGGLELPEAAPASLVDPGEATLNLSAWGADEAGRSLPRASSQEGRLAQLDRADAVDAGVDNILAAR